MCGEGKEMYKIKKAWCTCRAVVLLIKPIVFWRSRCRRRRGFVRSQMFLEVATCSLVTPLAIIFIDMFAPKWARGPHNLARFPSWDPCITPGYWAWYLNVLPTSGSLFRSLFYAFMPREGIYTCVFGVPFRVFVAEHGLGSWRYPSLCFGSRSPGCDTSFELPFIAWVAFRLDFMAGIHLHFIS